MLLDEVARNIQGKCLCALGDFSAEAVISGIERFRKDFEAKVKTSEKPSELKGMPEAAG